MPRWRLCLAISPSVTTWPSLLGKRPAPAASRITKGRIPQHLVERIPQLIQGLRCGRCPQLMVFVDLLKDIADVRLGVSCTGGHIAGTVLFKR